MKKNTNANNYRKIRKSRGKTLYDMAELFEVTPQAISMFERGLFNSKRLEQLYNQFCRGKEK